MPRRSILIFCIMLWVLTARGQAEKLLQIAYTPSFAEGSIESYLADIQQKTSVPISFSASSVDVHTVVRLDLHQQTVGAALNTILANQKTSIIVRRDKVLIVSRDGRRKHIKQQTFAMNGYVKEAQTKEALIGAVVYIPGSQAGTVTNSYGYYSLSVPEGTYSVVSTYLGFQSDTTSISLKQDVRKDFFLSAENKLEEVKVTRKAKDAHDHKHFLLNDIEGSPALLGENDIMRTIQNTAGVQSAIDGTSSILVRGGDPGQNLYLLDGVPVYYADHMSGLTSVFNMDAVKSVDFYKDAFPARFGGRLASVVDVNTRDGDMERWGGQFSFGLVKSSLTLEGPIVKDKASVMLSARRTWIDVLWRPFTDNLGFNFYDLNGKVNYIVNKNNRIYLSFYNGRDRISSKTEGANEEVLDDFKMQWGNAVGSVKWTSILDPKIFVNTVATYSRFNFQLHEGRTVNKGGATTLAYNTGKSFINDYAGKVNLHYYPNLKHHIEAGVNYAYSDFNPVSVIPDQQLMALGLNLNVNRFSSNEVTLFAEDEIKIGQRWILRPGLHWANWFNKDYNYSSLQPRIYTAFKIAGSHTIYSSFTQMAQYLHFINNNELGVPVGFYLPSTSRIEPEEALLWTMGYTANFPSKLEYNVDLYYKDVLNVTTFDAGKNIFDNNVGWEDKITQGKGWSYGAEFTVKKGFGPLSVTAAYTLSWTWRKFASLNNGAAFPYRYDRRHNLKTMLAYEPTKRFSATANWTYMSGEAITLPDQISPDLDNSLLINLPQGPAGAYTYNYSGMNNYRLPAIHRLDLGFNFRKQKRKNVERTWSFGVFNAYARRNVMYVELVTASTPGEFQLMGMSFLQFVPYLTYKLRF